MRRSLRGPLAGVAAASALLAPLAGLTPASALAPADPSASIVINEVESNGGVPGDWIELANRATVPVDVSGLRLKDDKDDRTFAIAAGTVIPGGGYLVLDEEGDSGFGFGLGSADAVRLFAADGTTLIDSYSWEAHATTTYGRIPDITGEFALTGQSTRGAANTTEEAPVDPEPTDPEPTDPAPAGPIVVNEVESNGDDTDWVEFANIGTTPVDLSGYRFVDNDASHVPYSLPAGSIVAPGDLFVVDGEQFDSGDDGFGLGGADSVFLYAADGTTLVASYSWTSHSLVTYGRCDDGADLVTTTRSTKGEPNDCSAPLVFSEVESQDGDADDWVEIYNAGVAVFDASGLVFRDSDDSHGYTLPAGTTVEAGAYLVLEASAFGFGLGGSDSVRLFDADGVTLVDEFSWTEHAEVTYGACPLPTSEFGETSAATKGSVNRCVGYLFPEQWPGGQTVTVLDEEDTFSGDMRGIDWEPSGTSAPGTLWAVQNDEGLLYKIVSDGQGGWSPATTDGWSEGKAVRYPDGTGVVDAEGVTVANDDSAGGIYVSSERNGDADGVSRPSVLYVDDLSGTGTELTATTEWNLAADFPGLGANAGLEGITWVPDSYLVGNGFLTSDGVAYEPSDYPLHGDGLFFVGVEGTAGVYAYALMADGAFEQVAELDLTAAYFDVVADVQFAADRGGLWVVCDDACDGRTAFYEIARTGEAAGSFVGVNGYARPADTENFANEGFALADDALCVDGLKPTFYVDDNDTDGVSLREGTITCTVGEQPGGGQPGGGQPGQPVGGSAGGTGSTGSTSATLAKTGADPFPGLVAAALLVAAGAGFLTLRRRRAV